MSDTFDHEGNALDDLLFWRGDEDYDGYPSPARSRVVTCRYCGKKGLKWKNEAGRWLLFEGGWRHTCRQWAMEQAVKLFSFSKRRPLMEIRARWGDERDGYCNGCSTPGEVVVIMLGTLQFRICEQCAAEVTRQLDLPRIKNNV